MEGSYDIDMDGVSDKISLSINGRPASSKSSIVVNDLKMEFYLDRAYDKEVQLIDLDKNDSYIEVVCRDDGPSDDVIYIFFRYNGEKLFELGSISSYALINEQGKLISGFNINNRFKPTFCSAWYEIEDNTIVMKTNAIDKYLNQTYDFDGGDAYFIPFDKVPENIELEWGESNHYESGKVKIIDILYLYELDRILNFYFVEFPSGDKGLLYFWIGD